MSANLLILKSRKEIELEERLINWFPMALTGNIRGRRPIWSRELGN